DVAAMFQADTATAFYNYSTTREDLATLFESILIRFHFGVERDIAVTNNPRGDNVTGDDYIVTWGQRNRVGDPAVRERARYAVSRLMPEASFDAYIDAMPLPIEMRPGETWNENLVLGAGGKQKSREKRHEPPRELPHYH